MAIRLEGKAAVVTGAGRGLGKAIALQLAQMGAGVVVNDIGGSVTGTGHDRRPADEVVAEISDKGGKAVASYDNVADFDAAGRLIEASVTSFGRIDILVNNAGIVFRAPIWELDPADFRRVVDVHLFGTFNCTRHACVHMKRQGWGRIVNMVSRGGLWGSPGSSGYGAGKGGIFGLTNVIARDLAPFGITVNGVNPAAMTTRMVLDREANGGGSRGMESAALQRMLSVVQPPEDVAVVVSYLCSEEAAGINGQYFFVQGGHVGWFQPLTVAKSAYKDGRWTPEELAKAVPKMELPPLRSLY